MIKWAVQLNLSLDHVPGAAAVAQKEESGTVSKIGIWEQIYSRMFLI